MRMMAESDSCTLPCREKENGDPGKKELLRSPMMFWDGCSLICWKAVTAERSAVSFLMLTLLEVGGVAAAGAGAGAAGRRDDDEVVPPDDR